MHPELARQFASFATSLAGSVAIAVAPIGQDSPVIVSPQKHDLVAWSTIKAPIALAVVRQNGSVSADVTAALTESNNAAAEAMWSSLGPPTTAAQRTSAVLRDGGDRTTVVQNQRIRAGFTAFGQTKWSVKDQAQWTSQLPCIAQSKPILSQMRNVISGQRWGFGSAPNAAIKGGWGPDESGSYLVRQLAIIDNGTGQTAISIAALPTSGTFDSGTELVSTAARWLLKHTDQLPSGSCR